MDDFIIAFSTGFACTLGAVAAVALIVSVLALLGALLG